MDSLQWLAQYTAYCAIKVKWDGTIVEVRGYSEQHGLNDLKEGRCIADYDSLLFLHAMPLDQHISLPLITLNEDDYIRCEIIPTENEQSLIHIVDAENESQKQQQLQKKASALYDVLAQKEHLIDELNLLRDMLERKNLEVESASELKSNFISGMSHEFRSPLATVLGYAGMIEDNSKKAEVLDACAIIKRAASHVMALIDNILDASRFEQNHIELAVDNYSVGRIVDEINMFFIPQAKQKDIVFRVHNHIPLEEMYRVDPVRLRQIIINLVSNAIKFTTTGGVELQAEVVEKRLKIDVYDTGGGVDEAVSGNLFQPFSKNSQDGSKGAGLGLSIVRYIIELMQGSIYYSPTDKLGSAGSHFSVDVPIEKIEISSQEESSIINRDDMSPPDLSGERIVIVDDDEDVGALAAMLLSSVGAKTKVIEDPLKGIDYICDKHPSVAIIDYNLPQCTGAEVISRIKEGGYGGRIVALSAAGVEIINSMGADDVLQKPFSKKQLYKVVLGHE